MEFGIASRRMAVTLVSFALEKSNWYQWKRDFQTIYSKILVPPTSVGGAWEHSEFIFFESHIDFSTWIRAKTYLQENACHFVTTQSINTIWVPMERGAFRLPTVKFWSRPLQWVEHESTRKLGVLNWDGICRPAFFGSKGPQTKYSIMSYS